MIVSSVTTGYVGWVGLVASLALVGIAVAISLWQHLDLERSLIWASARAIVQLLAVGAVLGFVLSPHVPLAISWLWVLFMIGFAADTIRRRAPEVPGALRLSLLSLAVATTVSLAVLFGFGIFPLNARTLVPLAGMVIGNSLTGTVVAARRVIVEGCLPPLREGCPTHGDDHADRGDQGGRARIPAGGDDRTHSGRREADPSGARAGSRHVPDPRCSRHHSGNDEPWTGTSPVHSRSPLSAVGTTRRVTAARTGSIHPGVGVASDRWMCVRRETATEHP